MIWQMYCELAGIPLHKPSTSLRRVVVETPYRATLERTTEQHRLYLTHALRDCVMRQESPYASHGLLIEALDDDDPVERALGMKCGWAWAEKADAVVIYCDLGVSPGMRESIALYEKMGLPIERRKLDWAIVKEILA